MDMKIFHKRFKALSVTEQDILKVLSIAYEDIEHSAFVALLNACGVQRENGLPITIEHLIHYKEMLDAGGWIETIRRDHIQIAEKMTELTMRMAVVDDRFKNFARQVQKRLPYRKGTGLRSYESGIREIRLALYEGDVQKVGNILNDLMVRHGFEFMQSNFFDNFFEPFDPDWLNTFPIDIQNMALSQLLSKAIVQLEPSQPFEDFLLNYGWLEEPKKKIYGHALIHMLKIRQGKFEEALDQANKENFSGQQLTRKGEASFSLGKTNLP